MCLNRQNRDLCDFRRKQKEARENFLENVLRQRHKTIVVHDLSHSHEGSRHVEANRTNHDANRHNHSSSRSTPDLIKEPYHQSSASPAVTGKPITKDTGSHQSEHGEKKATANSKDSKLLNELTMKQIDSMSRTRAKSSMLNTKTDVKVPRPSLNQLKLTQQQQMVSGKVSNTMTQNTVQQNAKAGNGLMGNAHPPNTLSDKKQVREPSKSDFWTSMPADSTAICTSIDSVVSYKPSNQLPTTTKIPYTTIPSQGGSVMQPPVTQYPVTHLPVTCGTQSSMSVVAGQESVSSTSFAAGQNAPVNDQWCTGNTLK